MKVTLLVGPIGAGKTTHCLENYPNATRISQDEQGKEGHLTAYKEALKRKDAHIVIDRMNYNREQRARYVSLAQEHDYEIEADLFCVNYAVCYSRAMAREGHPNIPFGDEKTIMNVLDFYWEKFEDIRPSEKISFVRFVGTQTFTSFRPTFMDLSGLYYAGKRFIVVGDLHGCYDELVELKAKVAFDSSRDVLVAVGDLVDRGPKIREVLNEFRKPFRFSVMGNHDNKFMRYLKGNKVDTRSLVKTIEQTKGDEFRNRILLANMPYVISFGENYVVHAGFHPDKSPREQTREFCLYARKYDPAISTFTNNDLMPYWYKFPRKTGGNFFFGHEIHEDICQVEPGIYALDGGCYRGGKLRAAIVEMGKAVHIVEVDSKQPRIEKDKNWDCINKFEPYDKLVEQGYLSSQTNGDLVLYNYTEACTFEKKWNKYTLECRGLILDRVSGKTVARPFPKFFNLGENESVFLSNLPKNMKYECFEKLDGSLGILYQDPKDNMWKVATRGSFKSDQAIKATEIWNRHPLAPKAWEYGIWGANNKDYTLLFEIIYPENRHNPGARLVVDYGSEETLVILGAIHKVSGQDLPTEQLQEWGNALGLPVAKKFDYTIEQMIELQKSLPASQEGFVVRFENGLRVKIKGDEYCRMHRILNSITPLFILDLMDENWQKNMQFAVPLEYLVKIPEEALGEVRKIEAYLQNAYEKTLTEINEEYHAFLNQVFPYPTKLRGLTKEVTTSRVFLATMGIYVQKEDCPAKHKTAFFSLVKGQTDRIHRYIMKVIRPTGNKMGET